MAKILLVEDDNNLREIYEARLMAEGYAIVAARDGEEALTVAMKEKPDLIISDVMMPKISGFDMLDILRTTEETKDAKVIMMTALSQAEDKARAEKLGADRYLVKSQVTLEDVAKVAKEVLEGKTTEAAAQPQPVAADPATTPTPVADDTPAAAPSSVPPAATDDAPAATPTPVPEPVKDEPKDEEPEDKPEAASEGSTRKKVIQPLNDLKANPEEKLKELLAKEQEREKMAQAVQETIHKGDEPVPTAEVPAKKADAPTEEKPVEPPKPQSDGPDPNSIAL